MRLTGLAGGISEYHPEKNQMNDLYAESSFSSATCMTADLDFYDPKQCIRNFKQFHRLATELDDSTLERRKVVAASHAGLAQGYLLSNDAKEALNHCQLSLDLEAGFPDKTEDGLMLKNAQLYKAWTLCILERYPEAEEICTRIIETRARIFGPQDKMSEK